MLGMQKYSLYLPYHTNGLETMDKTNCRLARACLMKRNRFITIFLATAFALTVAERGVARSKDLRPLFKEYGISVKNQSHRGTCSVFALVGLIEFERANALGERVPLSVEYLNWAANRIEGVSADGSFFHYAIDGLSEYGICADDYMPYASRFSDKNEPSEAAKRDAEGRKGGKQVWIKRWNPECGLTPEQLEEVRRQLDADHPVAIGFLWPKSDKGFSERGELPVVERDEVFDGHSVLIVGYEDDPEKPGGGCLIFKNSYGESFGDKGYGYVPYKYALLYANDAMALRVKAE